MDEQMRAGKKEPEGERPDEAIEDLDPDEHEAETVRGGGIAGDVTDKGHEGWIE